MIYDSGMFYERFSNGRNVKPEKKRNVLDVCVYLLGLSGDMRSMWLGVVLSFFGVMLSMTGKIRSLVQIRRNCVCPVHSKLHFFYYLVVFLNFFPFLLLSTSLVIVALVSPNPIIYITLIRKGVPLVLRATLNVYFNIANIAILRHPLK